MSTYALDRYGRPTLYGLQRATQVVTGGAPLPLISSAYLIDPFDAVPANYTSIRLTWTAFDTTTATPMNEFRLLSSRYGFPVDENDGTVLFDTMSNPGSSFIDTNVVPGMMNYYAMYVLGDDTVGTPMWIRAGFTACLMPKNYSSGAMLLDSLPEYLRDLTGYDLTGAVVTPQAVVAPPVPNSAVELDNPYNFPVQVNLSGGIVQNVTADGVNLGSYAPQFWVTGGGSVVITYEEAPGWTWYNVPAGNANPYVQQFLNVAGWSLDYLRTQYDFTFQNLNDPWGMPLSDLAQLAGEIGVPFQSELPAYYMRKAVASWSNVMQQRGSLAGIAEHISLLTGYSADVRVSRNIMLENDQSRPVHPKWAPWSPGIPYRIGERVMYPSYAEWSASTAYIVGNAVDFNGVFYQVTAVNSATTTAPNGAVQAIPPVLNGTLQPGWSIIQGPYMYECAEAVSNLPGTAPPGTANSNTTWTLMTDKDDWFAAWTAGTAYSAGTRISNEIEGIWYDFLCTENVPAVSSWSGTSAYSAGTVVLYDSVYYECINAVQAPGSGDNTTPDQDELDWQVQSEYTPTPGAASVYWEEVFERLFLDQTNLWRGGAVNTWEAVYPSQGAAYSPASNVLVEGIGVPNPSNFASTNPTEDWTWNSIRAYNQLSSAQNVWVRSVIRGTSDFASSNTNMVPDPELVIQHGIPVPAANPDTDTWNPDIRYDTDTIVTWDGLNYIAQRASTGVRPPAYGTSSPEWAVLGTTSGVPLMISAYVSQSLSTSTVEQYAITPFVEWYDDWGNFIARVFSRTPTAGTAGLPDKYVYDGFSTAPGATLLGRECVTGQTWSVPEGAWTLSEDYAYPSVSGQQSIALVTVQSTATQAVTFTGSPVSGQDMGLIFWYQSSTKYWHAGMSGLYYNNGGVFTKAASYPSGVSFQPGDRIYVVTNYSTPSVSVYRNNTNAYDSTTGNGLVASLTGAGVASGMQPSAATCSAGIASEIVTSSTEAPKAKAAKPRASRARKIKKTPEEK